MLWDYFHHTVKCLLTYWIESQPFIIPIIRRKHSSHYTSTLMCQPQCCLFNATVILNNVMLRVSPPTYMTRNNMPQYHNVHTQTVPNEASLDDRWNQRVAHHTLVQLVCIPCGDLDRFHVCRRTGAHSLWKEATERYGAWFWRDLEN